MHEYNHLLGTPDTEHSTYKSHHFGLGGFGTEVYGGTQFNGILAPLNPYWRKNRMHWINGKVIVHAPIYNKPIQYWPESDSSVLVLDSSGANFQQCYYISAHNKTTYFDRFWPSREGSGGLMIYHVRKNVLGWSQSDGRHKNIDVEIASGLYNWYVDTCSIYDICKLPSEDPLHLQCWPEDESLSIYADQPNPICGFDSLDWRLPCKNVWAGNNGEGSINSFFDGVNYTEFDDFSNPSSKFCKSTYVDSQKVVSHLAVRHIHPHNGRIYADLLVNNYYGQLANSTTWGHATIHKGYAITGDITVPAGETLRILAGTDIYFQTHEDNQPGPPSSTLCGLDVNGTLIAEGTAEKPIRFISSSSQYDSGAAGDWYGIRILSGGKASLNHVEIKYAYNALAAYTPESLGISNSTISWSENCGIYAEGTSLASLNIIGVDFSHPGAKGIDLKNACANLEDVNIDKPNTYGIYYLNDINSNPPPTNPNDTLIFDQVEVHGTGVSSGNTSIGIQMSSSNYPFHAAISELTIEDCYSRGISLSNADSTSTISAFSINYIGDKGIYIANSKLRLFTPDGQECWYGWGINNCFHGIYCYGYNAKPKIRKVEITNISSVAVYNAYGLPYLGKQGDSYGCYNQIMIDTSKYDIYNYGGDSILVQENWWGENPPRIKAYGKYKISNSLTSRPCGPQPKIAIEPIPIEFELQQNYPNPFNSSTNISFILPSDQFVTLEIFNLLGQKVKTLVSQNMLTGPNLVVWHGDDSEGNSVASGIYLYLLRTDDYSAAKQMLMLR
jgi:hypothetical protein